ncbi:hypothetical protein BDW67DRAFT_185509 [Aspergillus spinulosporus]
MATARSPPATTGPAGLKLRDSCNRCAASKIKCSKEKPTCARCARQGRPCEYFATKRAGRKPGSRVSHPITPPETQEGLTATTTAPTVAASPWSLADPDILPSTDSYPDFFSEAPSIENSTIPTSASLDFHLADFPSSTVALSILDLPDDNNFCDPGDLDNFNHSHLHQLPHSTTPAIPHHQSSAHQGPPVPVRPPPPLQSELPEFRPATVDGLSLEQGYRLARALKLLTDPPFPSGGRRVSDVQSIMAENEQTAQAVSEVLHGEQGNNAYLIAVLSVVMLKVLARYAAVLRDGAISNDEGPGIQLNIPLGEENRDHKMRQQVLGQLHRVQRLVNILSQRFRAHGGRDTSTPDADCTAVVRGIESLLPFPDFMLEQFETDLRKRLRILSAEIVDMLR